MVKSSLVIGMILFKDFTPLDFFGPYEVFNLFPDAKILTLSKTLTPVKSEGGIKVIPDTTFKKSPQLDLIFIPGGPGVIPLLSDKETLNFIKKQGVNAKYIVSVCTGALVLGTCGLLNGYKATTYWASMDTLKEFGATPVQERFVVDRNRFTGGGVTAGIDLALKVANEIYGSDTAKSIQLILEYDPQPEFKLAGSPLTAEPKIVSSIKKELEPWLIIQQKAVSEGKKYMNEK